MTGGLNSRTGARGLQNQRLETDIGDFVLFRRDGLFSYQLAVVVDDATRVTDVCAAQI